MPDLMELSGVERQRRLLDYVHQNRRVSVQHIAEVFSVSLATARRDLNELAGQGKIQRVHGGALAIDVALQESHVSKVVNW